VLPNVAPAALTALATIRSSTEG